MNSDGRVAGLRGRVKGTSWTDRRAAYEFTEMRPASPADCDPIDDHRAG